MIKCHKKSWDNSYYLGGQTHSGWVKLRRTYTALQTWKENVQESNCWECHRSSLVSPVGWRTRAGRTAAGGADSSGTWWVERSARTNETELEKCTTAPGFRVIGRKQSRV